MFRVLFRTFYSDYIWIYDTIQRRNNSTPTGCNSSHSNISSSSSSIIDDGITLLDRLLAMPSMSSITVSSNSTTGLICPSVRDIDENGEVLNFVTKISFIYDPLQVSTNSDIEVGEGAIVSGSSGDVPPIYLVRGPLYPTDQPQQINITNSNSTSTLSFANYTTNSTTDSMTNSSMNSTLSQIVTSSLSYVGVEVLKGFGPFVRAVQRITVDSQGLSGLSGLLGMFRLCYETSYQSLSVFSLSYNLSISLTELISFDGASVTVKKGSDLIEWTVTFPASFGEASILRLIPDCARYCLTSISSSSSSPYFVVVLLLLTLTLTLILTLNLKA
jgi:hypothetical protein